MTEIDAELAAVVALEQELLDPACRADATRLRELLHPDFLEYGASGTVRSSTWVRVAGGRRQMRFHQGTLTDDAWAPAAGDNAMPHLRPGRPDDATALAAIAAIAYSQYVSADRPATGTDARR